MTERPETAAARRRYVLECERTAAQAPPATLANDAMEVALEWGDALRLDEDWRLTQRQPQAEPEQRAAALVRARTLMADARALTEEAWPRDGRPTPVDAERVDAAARERLAARFPEIDAGHVDRAIGQAHYVHWRG